jgi:uncharacterized protein involved in propanediol utilization
VGVGVCAKALVAATLRSMIGKASLSAVLISDTIPKLFFVFLIKISSDTCLVQIIELQWKPNIE